MSEIIYTNALTTVQRIKDRLGITSTGFDTLILRLINAATDFIETYCNRKFMEQTYTNEVYTINYPGTEFLMLKQAPVSVLTSLEYRAGMPSDPNYTAFIRDNYELVEDGKSGIVRIYGGVPKGVDVIRATYTAGYKIDWANFGSSSHTLPADLTELCERIVIRTFKRREAEGKTRQSYEGGLIEWQQKLPDEDQQILNKYVRQWLA